MFDLDLVLGLGWNWNHEVRKMKLDEMELLNEMKLDDVITTKRNKEMSQCSEVRKSD